MEAKTFDLLLNRVPYVVKATPFAFNTETRYKVTYNDSPEFIFVWDDEVEQYVALGDESATMPDDMEEAVAARLLQME
jgi:hypothetical protein